LLAILTKEGSVNRTYALLLWFLLIGMFADFAVAGDSSRKFQKAVVVTVQEREPNMPRRRNPTDAPVARSEKDYDISLRVNCSVYVGRYEAESDDLPGAFAVGQALDVSPGKRVLYVKIPGSRDTKMTLIRRYAATDDGCGPR
jgi:hypothetical protein